MWSRVIETKDKYSYRTMLLTLTVTKNVRSATGFLAEFITAITLHTGTARQIWSCRVTHFTA